MLEDKKRGNSDHIDRIDILESFICCFGKEAIGEVVGDREFIGKHWLTYLKEHDIAYVLRLKENGQYISNARGKMVKIKLLFASLSPSETVMLGLRKVGKSEKMPLYCTAHRSPKGELIVLIHTKNNTDPITSYAKRWGIETMFKAFKSSGFDIEATHITDSDRLHTLLSVVAIAFCIACKTGEIASKEDPIPIKKHSEKHSPLSEKDLMSLLGPSLTKLILYSTSKS